MIRVTALLLLVSPSATSAAERHIGLGSFDRIRVEGPLQVRIGTGSPGGTVTGDRGATEAVDVALNGTTLTVRPRSGIQDGERRTAVDAPPVITLTTPSLHSAAVFGGARLTIGRMKADKADLSISGAGAITVTVADTRVLNVTVIGAGMIEIGGRTSRARLVTNGVGTIDAAALQADDLFVRLDGPGATRAHARYTAEVANTGLGTVVIDGNPRCTIKAIARDRVTCGPKL